MPYVLFVCVKNNNRTAGTNSINGLKVNTRLNIFNSKKYLVASIFTPSHFMISKVHVLLKKKLFVGIKKQWRTKSELVKVGKFRQHRCFNKHMPLNKFELRSQYEFIQIRILICPFNKPGSISEHFLAQIRPDPD